MSSSSRARPFSFSPAVQDALGPPGPVNEAVCRALPSLFDGSVDALLRIVSVGARFPRVVVREGRSVPAGTPGPLQVSHAKAKGFSAPVRTRAGEDDELLPLEQALVAN